MRRFSLALLGAMALCGGLSEGWAQEPARQGPTFRTSVERVTISATVRDRRGRIVRGLSADDFEVLDRGEPRPILEFRHEPAPVSVALLFDISGSMTIGDRAAAARFAAHRVLSWLEPGRDEAALFSFDSRLHEVAPFTVDTRALQGALGEVDPFGATSLHDAIAHTARRVADRSTGRRRAVIVLTDGVDTASRLSPAEVSGIAAAIDVPVYVIATVLGVDNPETNGRTRETPATGTIEDLANWTGGALFYATSASDIHRVTEQVVDELRLQYLMAFEPAAGDGWHPLEVRTREDKYVVRARSGYVAGGSRVVPGS